MASQAQHDINRRSHQPSELTLEVEKLLKRYPNLSEEELATLIDAFPRVPILDAALMTADDDLSEQVEAFHRDHGRKLRTDLRSLAAALAFPAIVLVGLLWWAVS